MSNRAKIERELINQILESDKLEGVPLVWLQTRLGMLVSGIPPEEIFLRQQAINQKMRTVVSHAEIALRINEHRLKGCKIQMAKEIAAKELNASFSNADLAWKSQTLQIMDRMLGGKKL